jgi:hypothetical protein
MHERSEPKVLDALLIALRPIARALLKIGIGYREFNEIAKAAFVDVATTEYGLRGRPTNISRVAVMTGLTRKEVRRIRDRIKSGNEAVVAKSTPLSIVLHSWYSDEDFLDDHGKPRPLSFDGQFPSFSDLVKRAGGDIPPGAMRTELKRIDAVEESDDKTLRPLKRYATAFGREQLVITGLTRGIYPMASTVAHNVESGKPEDAWLQRTVSTDMVRTEDVARLRRISYDRLEEFTEAIDDLYSAYETLHSSESKNNDSGSIGIGVFYFEE